MNEADSASVFRDIVEQAPDAIIFADSEGAIRVWNRGAERIFGHAAAEVVGKSLDVIIPERLRPAHWTGYQRALESGNLKYADRVLTTRSVHKSGATMYVDLSFGLVRDPTGAIIGALAIARDVTQRYLEEKARKAQPANPIPAKPT